MATCLRNRRLNQKIYASFDGKEKSKNLPSLCLELLAEQKETWQSLREGYKYFKDIRERHLFFKESHIRLQFNPLRIISATAMSGERKRNEIECFLCYHHLPEGQKGILYRDQYLILCNPMPVLRFQLTIAHLNHCNQSIFENMKAFFQLMEDFGTGWMVLYNGPKCGASVPDHHHFHASPSCQMPIEKEIQARKNLTLVKQLKDVSFYRMKTIGRETLILKGNNRSSVEDGLKNYLEGLRHILSIDEEPMVNMAGFREEREWRLIIFPRQKHRPDIFFKKGKERILVSPGIIDMGGILVIPLEKDFERLDRSIVESIFEEVSLEGEIAEKAIRSWNTGKVRNVRNKIK